MRLWSIILLAITCGVGLGFAGTIVEFGMVTPPPGLDPPAPRRALQPRIPPPAPGEATPKVEVDNAEHDFGTMGFDGTGSHTFVFTNVGNGPLKLEVGDPPCKCTVGELTKPVVPPGESAEVTVEYEPGSNQGTFSRTVPIHTNDPHVPGGTIQLLITGRVVPLVNISPPQFLAYGLSPDDSQELTAVVQAYQHEDLEITGHRLGDESLAEFFEVGYEPIPAGEADDPLAVAAYRVRLNILPGLPRGRISQTLYLETNIDEQPEISVDVFGNVNELITVAGSGFDSTNNVLTFGTIPQGESATRQLSVLVRDESLETLEVSVAATMPESLQVELGNVSELGGPQLRRIPLTITIPKDADSISLFGTKPDEMGRIVLATNHPEQPEITIYVRLIVGG